MSPEVTIDTLCVLCGETMVKRSGPCPVKPFINLLLFNLLYCILNSLLTV